MTAQARLLGGRYQVGELLGYGGMAEVHRGRDLRLGRDVAIKMLRTDLARDRTFQERFRREAQNAAALNHPAIVAVYDTGEERASTGEALPFIVMEFVNGKTLKEVLGVEGRLDLPRALEITADMCAALEFSHRHGIIHRDIKPGNVMLTQTGQVKVMDFGIARAMAGSNVTMTQTSAVIGTAQYLSPEQARGESVDARSDVYAAGCVLFELLCGHPPFVGDSPVSVAYQHVREDPRSPSSINPEITPDVDAVILKALSKNPINRYQSAGEMRADLMRAASGRAVMATPVMGEEETAMLAAQTRPISPGARTATGGAGKRKSTPWLLAILSALAVLAVIAGVVALLNMSGEDEGKTVAVPEVVGLSGRAAEEAITKANLQPSPGEPVKNSDCEKNRVAKQDPPPGTQLELGKPVTYQMCVGPDLVTVPDLKGTSQKAAESTLTSFGLVPEFEEVNSAAPAGEVVEVPRAGDKVEPDTKIVVRISKGNQARVPDVTGRSQADATTALRGAGFDVEVRQGGPSENPGIVVEQSPEGGVTRNKNSTVIIVVSTEQVDTPPTEEPTEPGPTESPDPGGGIIPGVG